MSAKWEPGACCVKFCFPQTIYSKPPPIVFYLLLFVVCVCFRFTAGALQPRRPEGAVYYRRGPAQPGQRAAAQLQHVPRGQERDHPGTERHTFFSSACLVSIPTTRTRSPGSPPAQSRPASRSMICILVPQCPVLPTAVLSSATINRLPAEGPSIAAESALIRVCACVCVSPWCFSCFLSCEIIFPCVFVLLMSVLLAQPCSQCVGQDIHLLPRLKIMK